MPDDSFTSNETPLERTQPSELADAYNKDKGPADSESYPLGDTTLAEREERLLQESQTRRPKRSQTLGEAYAGQAPEDVLSGGQDSLPDALKDYQIEDIEAACLSLGIEDSELDDERWTAVLADKLEAWGAKKISDEDSDESASEDSEETQEESNDKEPETEQETAEEKPEEQKPEAQAEAAPLPKTMAELTPEQWNQLDEHVTGVWNRAEQVHDPLMKDVFTQALAKTLSCGEPVTPEGVKIAGELSNLLAYGSEAAIEATLPRVLPQMLHQYMAENIPLILDHYLPGIAESHLQNTVKQIWSETLQQDEFKDLGLPEHGTPAFKAAAEKVNSENKWLDTFDPVGPDGKQLPALEAARIKAAVTARLLAGQRLSPKQVMQQIADGVAAGKKQTDRSNRRVSASRALKGGRSTGHIEEKSDFMTLGEAYRRAKGDPF